MKRISYSRQSIDESDIQAVCEMLRSDFLTQGTHVPAFEESLKRYLNVEHVIAVSNGTSALHLAYLALDLKDSVVFTSPITFAATSNMLHEVGAKVRFVDVNPLTGLMDIDSLNKALKSLDSGVKAAIVPISMHGLTPNLKEIYELAKQYNCYVVEDAAHSLGGEYHVGKKIVKSASCMHTDMATLSFHPLKSICCGEGGAVTTNNAELAEKVRLLRNHGLARVKDTFIKTQEYWGYNYRITDIQAALGISQLKRLPFFLSKRQAVAKRYYEVLTKEPYCNFITLTPKAFGSSNHLFVIHFKTSEMRDAAYMFLQEKWIETQVHYMPLYHFKLYKEWLGELCLPGAESYYKGCLSIPIYPDLKEEDQDYIFDVLAKCCESF